MEGWMTAVVKVEAQHGLGEYRQRTERERERRGELLRAPKEPACSEVVLR
jgi:hypothetical protein